MSLVVFTTITLRFALPDLRLRVPLRTPFTCVSHTHTHTHIPGCDLSSSEVGLACWRRSACVHSRQLWARLTRWGATAVGAGAPGKRRRPLHPTPTPRCWAEGLCSGLLLPRLASAPVPLEPRQQPSSELGKGATCPPGASNQDTRGAQQTSRPGPREPGKRPDTSPTRRCVLFQCIAQKGLDKQ